jgi:hypothetical protein
MTLKPRGSHNNNKQRGHMTITREQIKKAFVSEIKNIDEYGYNNQDWYQQDEQRLRYILATFDVEGNFYRNCIEFRDKGEYLINSEQRLSMLMKMTYDELVDYVNENGLDWLGDDYDHINEYLYTVMNEWQDEVEFEGTDMENPDCMTIDKRARQWNVDPETGYKSENKHEVAYNILMDYFDELPEETRAEAHKRLEAIGC